MWLKMARVGEKWEHEDRLRESCLQQTCNVAPMYLLEKDHKPRKPGQLPATRPVVSGCSGMGLSLSNLLSDHLESIANSRENPIEVISTEDLLSRIHEYNEKLSETNPGVEKVLIGGDCVNLFPSLLAAESGRIVRESTIKIISQSNLTVDGLDYRELAKYVRMNMSDYEIITRKLSKIVPVRKYTRGAMPGMRGSEAIRGVIPEDEELMRDILDKAKIERHLEGLYVDDLQYVLSALPPGVRWSQKDKSFIHREDWRIEDESSKESSTRRTSREICQAMNSVYKSLNFTVEIEIDFEKLRLPTLDCELFMSRENYKISYSVFEKPTRSPFCVMKKSAMSEKSKISILSQDLIRRMQNTEETIPESERIEIIDNYIDRLLVSGYSPDQTREIIESGLRGYSRKLSRSIRAGVPLHRPAAATLQSRIKKKLTEKSSWYKKKPKGIGNKVKPKPNSANRENNVSDSNVPKVISVMFVAKTPNSGLANRLKEADKKLSEITEDKLRFVERSGNKLRSLLHRADPWDGQKCDNTKCLICTNPNNKTFKCSKRNIVYKSVCLTCKEKDDIEKKGVTEEHGDSKDVIEIVENEKSYWGESHVSGRERSIQHNRDFLNKKDDSHQFKHYTDAHKDIEMKDVKFGMSVVRQFYSSFSRQIFEYVQ